MNWDFRRINPYWIIGILVTVIILMAVSQSGGHSSTWPLFLIFFWIGPRFFRGGRRNRGWTHDTDVYVSPKHKNDEADEAEKPKHDQAASRYVLTDDGEVMEVVDEPDAQTQRRDNGFV